jgi:ABC-type uncharacterized transport system permease subunit
MDRFFLAVVVYGVFPLAPLGFELFQAHQIGVGSLVLSTAMYILSLGFASRWKTVFILGLLIGVFFSFVSGVVSVSRSHDLVAISLAWWALGISFGSIVIERFYRHVVLELPVLDAFPGN